ncbi:zinc-dependent alcohol dehydrogenase family protein [Leptospira mayottensis]|uniref:Alcohol dehydrogenase, catalytic domain, GroES-like family n=2 Tax=Leptospira mayottensis TaxID=1137606 RepID=A0AA87MR76_9LEPT|nr:NAD(P)-dependent alcohol dehydrogenase [Leptospira mayottensis]AXR60512.1 NAD(P)-dependent alcohol dehydrogenase [Leptospira mayottensis]AXR64324.1 NAD(P)-dependent alcohol dehydrogenase [Leptospira mayottensis]AZQ03056.1 NAD(P)-dependent alcohol dehydrogenase [Leptospira mayottensis 200901116]EKS02261.1 alcohol dehydrogenase, catalytic domain, GroES-like family [Leptospira mayottensis 200901122]TGN16988.1 NAD(P)-dependent alcohol dehydrogenase [Leptospira mayottensis]
MKVYEIQNQFGLENLKISERPDPIPGQGEVLVRFRSVSLNYRDYLMAIGKYNPKQKLPLIPLSDGAGEIAQIGPGVTKWKVGDKVCANFAQSWFDGAPEKDMLKNTLGGPLDGTLCEYRVFGEQGLVSIPEHLSFTEASTLPCAALTAYTAIVTHGNIQPGATVVVQGTGGVSIFALQFAKMMGCKVIATSSSKDKLDKVKALGADEVINYNEKTNWDREVRKITNMKGADLIIEVGGAGTLQKSISSTKPWGTIALIGVLAGGESNNLSLFPILMQGIRIQGIIVGSKRNFEDMNQAIDANKIKPVVDQVYSFEEAYKAFDTLKAGKHFGKVCIEI